MSAISRRALLSATAAAGAMGIPIAAEAGIPVSDLDAELFALLDRFDAAKAAWDATGAPLAEARRRADTAYPPRPEALRARGRDIGHDLGSSGREPLPNGRWRSFYTGEDVRRLRAAPPLTRWARVDDSVQPPPREPDPEGEARRQELVRAHDTWMAARGAVEEEAGLLAAARACLAAGEAWEEAHDAVAACRAQTPAGLARKAAWVVERLEADGDIGLAQSFTAEVAAFGATT